MALLCSKLNLTWACLTAFSSTGQHYQHCGAAHAEHQEKLLLAHPGFLACMENPTGAAGTASERFSHTSLVNSRGPTSGSRDEASREEGSESPREESSDTALPQASLPRPVSERPSVPPLMPPLCPLVSL